MINDNDYISYDDDISSDYDISDDDNLGDDDISDDVILPLEPGAPTIFLQASLSWASQVSSFQVFPSSWIVLSVLVSSSISLSLVEPIWVLDVDVWSDPFLEDVLVIAQFLVEPIWGLDVDVWPAPFLEDVLVQAISIFSVPLL